MERRKHILSMLLLVASCLFSNSAFAQTVESVEIDGIYYNLVTKIKEAEVTSNPNKYTGAIKIPETVSYNNVTYSVTSIGGGAFSGCPGLTSVTIPNSVRSIGDRAFSGCSGLEKVIVPDIAAWCGIEFGNYYANPLYYAKHLYSDETTEITNLIIPNSVTSIGESTFEGCSGLTSVTIPNSVISIGEEAFYNCSGLTSVTIPNSVRSMGDRAFSGCSGLEKVIVPDIAAWCGIEFGNYYANPLYYSKHLYSDETTEITNLIIPNSVKSIGDFAFYNCSGLTSVTIPNSVRSIGDQAFSGCSGLEKVIVPDIAAWCSIEFGNAYANPLYYSKHLYSDETTEITNLIIPNSVTSIGYVAFSDCSGLTSVTIPNSVRSIGDRAFEGCSGLTSITIPNSVISIGDFAFEGCSGLTSVTIPNSVISIGEEAFSCCSGLTTINVEAGNTVYDSRNNCNAIIETATNTLIQGCKNTTIPNSVTSIGYAAFYDCSGLTSVTIPNSVTSIGEFAFSDCSGLTSVTLNSNAIVTSGSSLRYVFGQQVNTYVIGEDVTSIGDYAFYNCSGLTSVTIGNSVTSIGYAAFYNCSGLTSVTIPNSVTSIGEFAFSDCSGLTSVTIGNSVKEIGSSAFADCAELTDVYCYAEIVPSTDGNAFYRSSTGNATLHVPAASIEQYKATKPWSNFGTIVPLTDEDAIAEVQAVPVLIQTQGNTITVEGAEAGTEIILYGINGVQLDSVIATTGVASLSTSSLSGSVAIIKIGNKTLKVLVKQ